MRVSKELFPQMVQKTIFRWNLISKIASIFHETAKISSNKVHDSSLEIPCFSLYPTLSLITAKFPYDFNLNRKNLIMHLKTFLKLCLTRVLPFWNEWKKKTSAAWKAKIKKKKQQQQPSLQHSTILLNPEPMKYANLVSHTKCPNDMTNPYYILLHKHENKCTFNGTEVTIRQ